MTMRPSAGRAQRPSTSTIPTRPRQPIAAPPRRQSTLKQLVCGGQARRHLSKRALSAAYESLADGNQRDDNSLLPLAGRGSFGVLAYLGHARLGCE